MLSMMGALLVTLPSACDQSVAFPGSCTSETVAPLRRACTLSARGVTAILRTAAAPPTVQWPHAAPGAAIVRKKAPPLTALAQPEKGSLSP